MEWISVEDRLPESQNIYLASWDYDGHKGIVGEAYHDGSNKWVFPFYANEKDVMTVMPNVTHWQPLPEPPKGEIE